MNLNFWIREKTIEQEGLFLNNVYPQFVFLLSPQIEINSIQLNLLTAQKTLLNDNYKKYLTTSSYNFLFTGENESIGGVYGSCNEILLTSYEITVNESSDSLAEFQKFFDNYQSLISIFIDDTISDLDSIIAQTKSISLITSIIYIIFSFFLYILMFNSLISDYYKKIKNIQKLEEIIPSC